MVFDIIIIIIIFFFFLRQGYGFALTYFMLFHPPIMTTEHVTFNRLPHEPTQTHLTTDHQCTELSTSRIAPRHSTIY